MRRGDGRQLRHGGAGIARLDGIARRGRGRFRIRGGHGSLGFCRQPAQPARRQHRFGHQQGGQGQGGPHPGLQPQQPFAHHPQRHADDAGGQHGKNDQVQPAALIVKAQPQGCRQPGNAVQRTHPAHDEVAEHQRQHQGADGDGRQHARADHRAGAPAARRQFPAQQQAQVQRRHDQVGQSRAVIDGVPGEDTLAQPQGNGHIQHQRPQ
ncbi:hypothetical protein D3C73_953940 [compost metagenome]